MTTIATFYQNSDYNGISLNLSTTNLQYSDLSTVGFPSLYNHISSLMCLDISYIIYVYTGTNFTGTGWAFRFPTVAKNLSQYGINDSIKSVKAVYVGAATVACTLFEDAGALGKSSYIGGPIQIDNITQTNYPGNIGNDKLSSIILYNHTKVTLYKDINCVNKLEPSLYNDVGYPYTVDVTNYNDQCSSLLVEYY